jgi:protein gp37
MNKTNIEWCDQTWNPVTGCLHGCPYCYARKIAERFGKRSMLGGNGKNHVVNAKFNRFPDKQIFPFKFDPTFYEHRLSEPQKVKEPQNIFVCSMADLFGEWVPDEWIHEVFKACEKAPQHRYLFLTKNQNRYIELNKKRLLPMRSNFWYGTTTTTEESRYYWSENHNFFISIEPIMGEFSSDYTTEVQRIVGAPMYLPWVIVGAETGNRKGKVIPERKWIENIVNQCRRTGTSVFLKDNLAKIWVEPLIQEYPWVTGEGK